MGRYEVVCELDLANFDDARVGQRTARRAHAELRRLARRDRRIDSTRLRRTGRQAAEISVTVAAVSAKDALFHCHGLLRTAVHATGGSTRCWEHLCIQVRGATPVAGTQSASLRHPPTPLAVTGTLVGADWAGEPSWAAMTANEQRRGAVPDSLPPLAGASRRATVIDLRDE